MAGRKVYFGRLPEAEWFISGGSGSGGNGDGARGRVDAIDDASCSEARESGIEFDDQCARRRADVQRMRHADGAERRLLQVRKLREHERMQLNQSGKKETRATE